MSADQNPQAPREDYSIDFSDAAPGPGPSGTKPVARGELPPPASGEKTWPKQAKPSRASDFWALVGCNAIVFGASVCIMVLELTASRLIAKHLGSSLYTWTSVIGVVLAGISVGNYVGGWLADKFPQQKVLSWLFLLSGLLTFSVLFFNNMAATTERPERIGWQLWVMLVVGWVFFLPALALGTISPVTASMALKRSAKTGFTVGNIYAWGALGSIVGTFLTGFWLIGEFGSQQVIWMTSAALVVMGALVAGGQRAFRAVALFGALQLIVQYGIFSSTTADQMANFSRAIAGIRSGWKTRPADFEADDQARVRAADRNDEAALVAVRERNAWRRERKAAENGWATWGEHLGSQLHELGRTLGLRHDDPKEFNDESDYYAINISDTRVSGDAVKELRLDHLIHSYWNPEKPSTLYYDYEQVYAAITERAAATSDRQTEVALESFPGMDEIVAAFPSFVTYDRASKTLSIRGAMEYVDLRRLLTIGPHAEFWQAMFTTWEQAFGNWSRASRQQGGMIMTDLAELPEGIAFPQVAGVKLHYDEVLRALVCTGPFTLEELLDLLDQGAMQKYVDAVRELFYKSRHVSALFIGGGGYVFPRWIEDSFAFEPRIDVAEIDPAVKAAIEKKLGLATEYGPPDDGKTYIRTHIGDARKFVDDQLRANEKRRTAGEPIVTYDFVYGDAFNDLSVPWHLTTFEFSTRISHLLTPLRGVYLVNIIDIYPRVQYPSHSKKLAGFDQQSDAGAVLKDGPPASLTPANQTDNEWQPAPAPFGNLQVFRLGEQGYVLGFRGVMQAELRDRLLREAGDDDRFREAIQALYKKSQAETVGQFLGRYVNTARAVFPCVYVFTSDQGEPGAHRDTFIVACSLRKLDFTNLLTSGNYWNTGPFAWSEPDDSGTKRDFGEMSSIIELARGKLLTDDFAPVDNLLAPVFVNRSSHGD